ncbi:MAG: FAD-dependent monooxygenase [Deinococcota bacterium]|jgi:2-polyprenyl-6-methoxyphenol hydroxylase-like FAD-dependent oxidoreductase|nr:FAD-dependent monooxygenase [Deinococcota bacterium]
MGTLPATTDVVIVGAGPTGLALAAVLATEGVSFVLVDRLAEGANTSRAAVVHARTLEVLEELEVTDRLRVEGHVVPRFTVRDRDHVLTTIRFDGLPTRYPYTLMVPQDITESILLGRLRELGGDVHRPYVGTDLRQDADGVTVTVAADGQQPRTVRARYAVGADGMHSTVRECAGIGFTGDMYEQSFVLADVRMSWPLRVDEVMLFFSPAGLVVVAPLPGGRRRVVATVDDAPERLGIADVQHLLDERGPVTGAARVDEIVWSSRFRVHHRVADRYRAGRILLAGDAAHVHSPAGGQGMNTGIQDAVALGHALAAVLAGRAAESRLDEYERTRRPVAERVVAFTDRATRVATLRSSRARSVRNGVIGMIGRIPAVRCRLAIELAGLRNR